MPGKALTNKTQRYQLESKRPVNIKRVRVVPRRRSSAMTKFFRAITDPEVAYLTKIERKAVRLETEAHHVSLLQEFANFAQVPTVADIAAPELDSKLVKYLESGRSSKGMKLLAAVLHVCPWMEKESRMGLPRACRGLGTAIANQMVIHGHNDMALFLVIAWISHARPNQMLPLQAQFLLKPGPASDHWCILLNPTEEGAASKMNEVNLLPPSSDRGRNVRSFADKSVTRCENVVLSRAHRSGDEQND